ncbi:MAG TPA: glycosyltransferase [Candidatus Binatia bacterium]|nr:glycosyltransferase [Candidatus Binatia bacterium]
MSEPGAPSDRRSVLVLTYRWPPQGGGGVQRTLKFVKYLGRFGWHPVVHTVANPYAPLWDASLESEVPRDVAVYRTPTLEFESLEAGAAEVARRVARLVRGARGGGGTRSEEKRAAPAPQARAADGDDAAGLGERAARLKGGGALARVQDWIWSRLLVPDPQIVWLPGALVRSVAIARRHGASVLYSTAPPQSLNVLALAIQRRVGIPWVADLRDPWTAGLHRNQWYPDHPRRRAREERWERLIFERASHVIVVTEAAREEFLAKYPWCPPDRVSVITNGFDPADFARVSPTPRFLEAGKLNVTVTGHVETLFDLVPFFEAVREVVEANAEDRATLRVNFVGTRRQPRYDAWIAERALGDVIRYHPYVPHADSVQYLTDSQVLMLCMTPVKEYGAVKILGKMCEYLYTRKPVLALTIPGVTSRILEAAGVGITIDPSHVGAMRDTLRRFLAELRAGGLRVSPNEDVIASFDRERQAAALARILDHAAKPA